MLGDVFLFMLGEVMLLMPGNVSCCIPSGEHLHLHFYALVVFFVALICLFATALCVWIIFSTSQHCIFFPLQHNLLNVCFVIFLAFSMFFFFFCSSVMSKEGFTLLQNVGAIH
jgi:hypothetical protein